MDYNTKVVRNRFVKHKPRNNRSRLPIYRDETVVKNHDKAPPFRWQIFDR